MEAKEDSYRGTSEGERALERPPSLDSGAPSTCVSRAVTPAQSSPSVSKLKQARVLFSHQKKEVAEVTIEMKSDPPRDTTLLPATPKLNEQLTEQASGTGSSGQDGLPGKDLKEEPNKTVKVKLTKAQREALKAEKERMKMEAKAKREAEKQERRTKREQEERERKEKKESERKRREEERRKKEEERRKKEEERRERKETERKLKEEEKRKREEERRKKEEEKEQVREEKLRKEQLAKDRFYGYFSKVDDTQKKGAPIAQDASIVTPFPIKVGMVLAKPPCPSLNPSEKANFDSFLNSQSESHIGSYIKEIRGKKLVCQRRVECPSKPDSNEVIIVSPVKGTDRREGQAKAPPQSGLCFKLLQFKENYRPAYYGTWQKSSEVVSARSPFRKDMSLLDYDVDSDDEWEEEEPGESISESEKEDEDSGGEEMEEDDGFFVPHGYLSEGEGEGEDSGEEMDITTAANDPNARRKQKQLAKAKAWEAEFARKCQPLKATQIGCVWPHPGHSSKGGQLSREEAFLQQFAAMALVELPIRIASKSLLQSEDKEPGSSARERRVPEEAMPDLIRSVHGSSLGLGRLVKSFQAQWGAKLSSSTDTTPLKTSDRVGTPDTPQDQERAKFANTSKISNRQLERKIMAIAAKETRPPSFKTLWYVHDSVIKQYGIDAGELATLVDKSNPSPPDTPCCSGGGTKKGIKRKIEGIPTVKSLFQSLNKTPPGGGRATNTSPSPSGTHSEGPKIKKRRIQTIRLDQCLGPSPTSAHISSSAANNTAKPQPVAFSPAQSQPSVPQVKQLPTCPLSEPIMISDNSTKENAADCPLLLATTPTSASKTVQEAITPQVLYESTNVQELEEVSTHATQQNE